MLLSQGELNLSSELRRPSDTESLELNGHAFRRKENLGHSNTLRTGRAVERKENLGLNGGTIGRREFWGSVVVPVS